MWLFGRQYPNFLRFYSNLLDVVFLLYDLTHLLQWQYLIDFHHPHHVSISPAVLRSFFHHWAVYNNCFCLPFPPCCADVLIPYSSPVPAVHSTLLPTSTNTPAPTASASHQPVLPKPCPLLVPPVWGCLGWSGIAGKSQLLMSLPCHSLFPGTHTDFRKRYCHFLNSVSSLDTHFSFPGISEWQPQPCPKYSDTFQGLCVQSTQK